MDFLHPLLQNETQTYNCPIMVHQIETVAPTAFDKNGINRRKQGFHKLAQPLHFRMVSSWQQFRQPDPRFRFFTQY